MDFSRHPLLRPISLWRGRRRGKFGNAGKNGLEQCGDASWEGIFRSIARQCHVSSEAAVQSTYLFVDIEPDSNISASTKRKQFGGLFFQALQTGLGNLSLIVRQTIACRTVTFHETHSDH